MHWCVVGGGMLGLTLAHRLAEHGEQVTILEAAPEIGGLASAWQVGDVTWDRHYHVTLLSDAALRSVLRDLDLDDEIRWVTTKTGFYANGQLSPMSDAIEYLKLPALTIVDKARLGGTILWGSRVRNWRRLEQTPVADWLSRLSGRRVFDRVWRPLLSAKLGDSYHDASAAFIWATIQRLYAARRSGLKEERFGYVPGGYARVLSRFADALTREEVEIQTGCGVTEIDRSLTVHLSDGRSLSFDRVIVTANPPVAARLCTGLTDLERQRLLAIRYQGVVCASLVLGVPLAPYYLTYITDPDLPFTAVVEMTAFVDTAETAGHHLVYLPLYLDPSDARFEVNDEALKESFWPALKRIHPNLTDDDLLAFQVSRVRNVFPIPTLGYSDSVPPVDTSIPGLHLVSSANIVNGTLNVNETVALAERTVAELLVPGSVLPDDRPVASLSLDLDNQWSYMKTHGDPGWEELPSYLDVVVPRVLSLLKERDLRITFFVVGTDADRDENARAIRALADAGHEIGNHSYRHEPWLHLYDARELEQELTKAEDAIERATGQHPLGFRGPGYSLSEDTLRVLVGRGYRYDASTLPTVIGPLARAFYFRTAELDAEQRRERSGLFGQFRDGLRPLRPYRWTVGDRSITELPVTTMPLARIPIHVSYLVYLARISPALARSYFRFALALCRRRGVEVSILLHPLDFLGADDVEALGFFPGMEMPTDRKIAVATDAIDELTRQFRVVPLVDHVASIEHRRDLLGSRSIAGESESAGVTEESVAPRPFVSVVVPAYNEALILMQSLTTITDYMRGLEGRYRWEVVVVNDGSTDETGAIADAFAATRPEVRVLHHKINFNLGQALQYAFGSCTGDYVVVIDCDLTYSVDHIGRMLDAMETQFARIVIASPYAKGGRTTGVPPIRGFMSRTANRILGWAAKGRLRTLTGMVRAYDRRFLTSLDLKALGPEINTEILYKAQLLRAHIVEIPAHLDWSGQRARIESRKAPSLRIKNTTTLQLFSSFLFRPLAFFVVPGVLLLVLALWSLGSVAVTWVHQIGHVEGTWDYRLTEGLALTYQLRPQTFIVGGVSLILAVQLISLGILAIQAKRYFEELFHLGTSILRGQRRDGP